MFWYIFFQTFFDVYTYTHFLLQPPLPVSIFQGTEKGKESQIYEKKKVKEIILFSLSLLKNDKTTQTSPSILLLFFLYLFIWLPQVLVEACGIFSCSVQDL